MTRGLSLRGRPSATQLLARILEAPDLAANVQALPSPVLAKLIDTIGLEDAGEVIAFASSEQLAEVFDEDLWKGDRPGGDERFDAKRFLLWLEVMLEAGDAFVAEKLASLPEDLVTLAIHKHVLVLNVEDLMAEMREVDEGEEKAIEKALSNTLSEEIDEYQLIARRHDGWDDVLAAILALDRDHHDILARILGRCCTLSAEQIDSNGGLQEVLTSEEMLEGDVAGDREDRRAEAGHVAASDAHVPPVVSGHRHRSTHARGHHGGLRQASRRPLPDARIGGQRRRSRTPRARARGPGRHAAPRGSAVREASTVSSSWLVTTSRDTRRPWMSSSTRWPATSVPTP